MGLDKLSQGFQLPDGSIVQVNIMDTAGQERYDSLNSSYYKNADCCILVYDITNRKTFDKITNYYISKIKENSKNIKKVILLGNKTDLKDKRIVSMEEGTNLALKNGFIFMESSCKDNYNVADAFSTLIMMTNTEMKINEEKTNTPITPMAKIEKNSNKKIINKKKNKCFSFN